MANTFVLIKTSAIYCIASLLVFLGISKIIFDKVYITSKLIVDEEFHLPLGLAYCKYDFFVWDPKVTTLPGLYLISAAILGPLGLCTTYWLRFVSLGASVINIILFHSLFSKYEKGEWSNIFAAITLALLPPLYFFSHLYYTDVVSLTMILTMFVFNEKENHYVASVFGLLSVLCRQTNIIWVIFVTGRYILDALYASAMHRYITQADMGISHKNLWHFMMLLIRKPVKVVYSMNLQFWLDFSAYVSVLLTFLLFIITNKSIVVGDKTAHEVCIHVPQLFYYSLFCLIFSWPHFVGEVTNFTVFAKRHKPLILTSLVLGIIVVYFNTLVHPYMLADNRHYVFYIWNRFYGKYSIFRYAMVPVYMFAWYVIVKTLYDKHNVSYLLAYLPCVIVVLVTQKLVDVRYYFIPYILFRLQIKNTTANVFNLTIELVTFIVINAITFNLFFTKTITWMDYDIPQRLICLKNLKTESEK